MLKYFADLQRPCHSYWQGFAYLEFLEVDAVQNALGLNDSVLRGRQIKARNLAALVMNIAGATSVLSGLCASQHVNMPLRRICLREA